jgi:hypothetical protein
LGGCGIGRNFGCGGPRAAAHDAHSDVFSRAIVVFFVHGWAG